MGLSNTLFGAMLPFFASAMGTFLMRQTIKTIPYELEEAAKIDGCNLPRMLLQIYVPLLVPALIAHGMIAASYQWNNFLWPLIINTRSSMHVLTSTMATLSSNQTTNYGMVMAGATLTFVFPFLLYVFLQKQFVEGVAMGGVKG